MAYASINNVYNSVQDILNKQMLGFVTPAQFNVFAPQAQRELFDEVYELVLAPMTKFRLQNLETVNEDVKNSRLEDISTLFVYERPTFITASTNFISKPSDCAYIRTMTYDGNNVSIVSAEQAAYYINSYYNPPTLTAPIVVKGSSGYTFYPIDITTATVQHVGLSFYKNPEGSQNGSSVINPPSWEYTQVGEDLLFNSGTSVDFELPKTTEQKLVYKVLALAGFSIREPEAVQFANTQEAKDKSTE